jgi:ubiquinone/menaquinone biosynthesis C-methylase UbiE
VSQITNRTYLKDQQYKTSTNLRARINLHRRYGVNPYPWQRWVYDQLDLEPGRRILELGCGPADLWRINSDKIPQGVDITLADLSLGMVHEARKNTKEIPGSKFLCQDAQAISSPQKFFNIVVANHMLYHVPNIHLAFKEISRVLKPDGRLYAATSGIDHMKELHEIVRKFYPNFPVRSVERRRFTLENAIQLAKDQFYDAEIRIYEDHLKITDVEPLIAYILSMGSLANFDTFDKSIVYSLESYLTKEIDRRGHYIITKSQGVLIGYL